METGTMASGSFVAETFLADPHLQSENVQKDAYKRRVRGQRASWRHVILVAASAALVFLIVKCTAQLASNMGRSVRMLAEGGGRSGKHQPLQVSDSEDEDDDECSGVSDRSGRRSKEGGKEPWWKFWKRSDPKKSGAAGESSPLLKEPSPGPSGLSEPSTSAAGSEGFDNAASGAHPPGGWVEHTTEVLVGELNSSHYEKVKRPYHYPKLGTGQRFQRLRQVLQKVEEVASGLCFLHSGPYASYVRSDFTLGSGLPVNIYIKITEVEGTNESGFVQFQKALTSWRGATHHHFRRDTACVTEEAVVLLLDDMEKNGSECSTKVPNGETATLAFVLEKPSSVPCSGKIMFEVYGHVPACGVPQLRLVKLLA